MNHRIETMPATHNLIAYDDCGVAGRQPHVRCEGAHSYSPANVPAEDRVRSVAWGWRKVEASYDGLRTDLDYVLAIVYANEPFNNRVQSLYAGGIQLHGPHALPRGGHERLLFRVPREAIRSGRLDLEFRLEAEVNVVVSAIELWAPLPPPRALHLSEVSALYKDLEGRVLDLAWRPVAGAVVNLQGISPAVAPTTSDQDGLFRFAKSALSSVREDASVVVVADHDGVTARHEAPAHDIRFEPARYRPIPASVAGLRSPIVKLDGTWRIRTDAPAAARRAPLTDAEWKPFRVPGQWLQQGHDVPPDKPVSVATAFTVPATWAGRRVVLRFDAVHAGARYWVNGADLGRTENLFTPVEWDITDHARFGSANRLDMEMVVQTESERLAHASGYAFHNLGGVPRSVHVFAQPQTHVRALHVRAGLAGNRRDGHLSIAADVRGPDAQRATVRARLDGVPGVREAQASPPSHTLSTTVPGVRAWSPETPNLYSLDIEVLVDGKVVERVARRVGFRTVEVRGSELLVNGRPVKLAGACRHETHPLTGRADTARWAREDVRLMKEAHLNYIRTAHYPPTQEFLDECDRQGIFVEVEAPFCWVGDEGYESLRAILTPTSAMVDYHHMHPSVIIWSLANESQFNRCFEVSNRLVKDLDPTRPTTFNNPDPKRICDIANVHYPRMPFDDYDKDDPRPLLLGEYFFPVCHEQTDVRRNPGLRELWGAGHSDPDSDHGRAMAREFEWPYMQPGEPPGAWTHIVRSKRVIGGAIWAALDEPFYLPGGKRAGYAWVHGFWGIVDGWRRPKPEHWLSRQIFSPVWFPTRRLPFAPGQKAVSIPVENRFAITDLGEVRFSVRIGGRTHVVRASAGPGTQATISVPLPEGAKAGDTVVCDAADRAGRSIVTCAMWLGESMIQPPGAAPGLTAAVQLDAPKALGGATEWPTVHVTRFDFADLWPSQPPFAVMPSGEPARAVNRSGAVVTVRQTWPDFDGVVTVTPLSGGRARVDYDFGCTGQDFHAREIGLRIPFAGHRWTLEWDRWSEWGEPPADTSLRVRGTAKPWRGQRRSSVPESAMPRWTWANDETEEGTTDFRSVKLNVFQASLKGPQGGLAVIAGGDVHVRAAVEGPNTVLYLLTRCGLGPMAIRKGDRLRGGFAVVPVAR